jgi:hypothetical protein
MPQSSHQLSITAISIILSPEQIETLEADICASLEMEDL